MLRIRSFAAIATIAGALGGCDLIAGIEAGIPGEGGSGTPTGGNGAGVPDGGNGGAGANGGNGGDGGAGGDGGNGGGGNPGYTNLATVLDLAGEPIQGADVLVHDAAGEFVELLDTGDDGTVELNVPADGSVTVVRHGFRQTFMTVPPNKPLIFRAQRTLPQDMDVEYTVTFSNPPATAEDVRFYSTCDGNSNTQPVADPTTILRRGDCRDRDTFNIMAVARNAAGDDVGYGFISDLPLDDLTPPTIPITSSAVANVTASAPSLPAGTTAWGAYTLILSDSQQLYFGSSDTGGVEDPVGPQSSVASVPNAVFFKYITFQQYNVPFMADLDHQYFHYKNSNVVPYTSVLPDIQVDRVVLDDPEGELGTFPFHSIEGTNVGDAMVLFVNGMYIFAPLDLPSPLLVPKMPPGFEQYDVELENDGTLRPGIAAIDFAGAADYAEVLALGFSFQAGFEGLDFAATQFNIEFTFE